MPTPALVTRVEPAPAPPAEAFPTVPATWYLVCTSRELRRDRLVSVTLGSEHLVLFRQANGEPAALNARCPHLGANLGHGQLVKGRVRCPYHGWEFDGAGHCHRGHLDAQHYAAEEHFGAVFVFLNSKPLFPFPRFELDERHLACAPVVSFELDTSWFVVGSNGFDVQHFRHSHARMLLDEPRVEVLGRYGCRLSCRFRVAGRHWLDRLTRLVAGDEVEFRITIWGGTLIIVETSFARDRTYGLTAVRPSAVGGGVEVHVIVSTRRSGLPVIGGIADAMRVRAKRFAIRRMLEADRPALDGLRYRPPPVGPEDRILTDYLKWVAKLPAVVASSERSEP